MSSRLADYLRFESGAGNYAAATSEPIEARTDRFMEQRLKLLGDLEIEIERVGERLEQLKALRDGVRAEFK